VHSSPVFWLVVLGSVVLYWRLPAKLRDLCLVAVSVGYLATIDPKSVISLGIIAGVVYLACERFKLAPRSVTPLLIAGILLFLGYHKYYPVLYNALWGGEIVGVSAPGPALAPVPVTAKQILVPLGASYFTFKLIHYVIESSRKSLPAHGPVTFLAYLFFFPIYAAGPIERFDAFWKNRAERFELSFLADGLARIILGIVKKFVLVDMILARTQYVNTPRTLAQAIPLWNAPFRLDHLLFELPKVSPLFVWQFLINQFATVYLDFSAYTDIAIGVAILFGVKVCENFDYPILATSVAEYWKRWHMSLSGWCQQYIYLPTLGTTRNPYLAVYATMGVMGLWHAGTLNYVCWGLYHATLLVIAGAFGRFKRKRKWKLRGVVFAVPAWMLTILCVSAGQAFVSTDGMGIRPALRLLARLFGVNVAPV
jgi:alginate O-acetyltransferase complex protein AlgI